MNRILLVLMFLPFAAFAQLSGSYVISSTQPAPFNKLSTAVSHLNAVGVSSAVTFVLDDAEYSIATGETFPIVIAQFPGNSATNNFTIKPNAGKTVLIKADNTTSYTPTIAVFKLSGADHVTIDGSNNGSSSIDLTIQNNNSLTYSKRAVIWLSNASVTNGANFNTIKNVSLSQISTAGATSMGIYAAGTAMNDNPASAPNSNITVSNVTFSKAGQGIYVFSSATAANQSQNWTVSDCRFGATDDADKGFLGIYFSNVKNFTITRNSLDGFLKATTSYNPVHGAIYTTGACSNGVISYNTISNVRETTGSGSFGIFSTGNNTSIFNNMVNNVRANGNGGVSNNGFGIYLASGQNVAVRHNTVRLTTAQSSGISAAMFVNSGSSLDIRNNIFVNLQSNGPTRYAIYSLAAASAFSAIDHNDYYSQQHIGYLGGNKPNFLQWKNATGKDANSISALPVFVSASDLHIDAEASLAIDNLGTPISGISDDIDGEMRSASTPDMGADEFSTPMCAIATTWNGTSWSNGVPSLTIKAIINGDYNTTTTSFKCCELVVNAGFTLTISANDYIEVENNITVNGNMIIANKGSLVQNSETATHQGAITVKRKTAPLKQYDYTYWASPVIGTTLLQLGTPSLYYLFNPVINNYVNQPSSTVMPSGKGFIARAPNNLNFSTPQIVEVSFNGVPNTGTIAVPVVKSAGAFNLIGNPFPSAIDADAFLTDPDNESLIGGTVYLWTHNTAISMQNSGTNLYNYTRDDYAKYNVTGGVKTGHPAANSNVAPVGKIASGQGFFIEALQEGTHNVYFKNAMRTKGIGHNGQFFKAGDNAPDANAVNQKHRIWLSISNPQQAYDEMLLGYLAGATNALDRAYDGKTFPAGNVVAIYSLLDQTPLAIQGRALPFEQSDVIPIGYMTSIAGTFSISLESFDGLFADQDVFLFDKTNGTYHNLKQSPFSFDSAILTDNDRFELRFTSQSLSNHDVTVIDETVILAKSRHIMVRSPQQIKSVEIFDMTGKLIRHDKNISATEYQSQQLNTSGTAVLTVVTFESSGLVSRKIVILE